MQIQSIQSLSRKKTGREPARPSPAELELLIDVDKQWYMKPTPSTADLALGASVNVVEAWQAAGHCGKAEIVIGFIDDGFDLGHPDLKQVSVKGKWRLDEGMEVVDDKGPPTGRFDFHGTACLGLAMGWPRDGNGIVGVAPGCSTALFRYDAGNTLSYLTRVLEKVATTADVICLAFGPDPRNAVPMNGTLSSTLSRIARSGGPRGTGVVICVAAGNQAAPISRHDVSMPWVDFFAGRDRSLKNEPLHDALASHPAVVTISASSSRNQRAGYSSWGRHVSLCAPSNDYPPTSWLKRLRFTPETRRITVPWNRRFKVAGYRPPKDPKRPYRDDFGGTSAATAMVAGAVGLIRSVAPDLHADEVKEILFSTALKMVDPQSDTIFKARYGVYGQVGQCNWFGHGKIDVAAAVREAKRVTELRGRA